MCKAFSCIVDRQAKVTWKLGIDSHESLLALTKLKDDTSDPALMTFARVEIFPNNGSYLAPDSWEFRIDQSIRPSWFTEKHQTAARKAHTKWLAKLGKFLVRKKIVHPFEIDPPKTITKQHINMLRKWDSVWSSVRSSIENSVRNSVWESVGSSVWDSVMDSVGGSVWESVWGSVRDSVRSSIENSVRDSVRSSIENSVRNSVWESVGSSVRNSVRDSVRSSVWNSVRDSVRDSVYAYIGSFFIPPVWKYIKHPCGKYPFAPCVKLWRIGLVPSFTGKVWRLHAHNDARIVFQIGVDELRKVGK